MYSILKQLEAITVVPETNPYTTPARKKAWVRVVETAHAAHTSKAIERYRKVMLGAGWLAQWEIEMKLGYARTVANDFLKKLVVELKVVEKRNKNGAIKFNRKAGYEYRWKEES